MKKIFLIGLSLLLSVHFVEAQRSSNQLKFKQSRSVAPSYKEENLYYNDKDINGQVANQLNTWAGAVTSNNELVIQCQALMNVKADSYLMIFNLTQVGQTAKEADDLIAKRMLPFTEALKGLGVTAADVYVDMVYLIPMYEFEVEKKLFPKPTTRFLMDLKCKKIFMSVLNDPT